MNAVQLIVKGIFNFCMMNILPYLFWRFEFYTPSEYTKPKKPGKNLNSRAQMARDKIEARRIMTNLFYLILLMVLFDVPILYIWFDLAHK